MIAAASVIALLTAGLVRAQKPAFTGDLLIQPGLSSAYCLGVENNTDGAAAVLQKCTGEAGQQWKFEGGSIKVHNDKCLDVVDGSTANGAKLQVYTCSDNQNPNQQFYYTPWGDNHITWTDRGMCVDLTDGTTTEGKQMQLWGCGQTNQVWNVGYMANALPTTSEEGQSGTNACGNKGGDDALCQTAWINSADDFCLWSPGEVAPIGESEAHVVAYCTKEEHGARVIPEGTLSGVHFVKTPDYVQVTGKGDLTKINVPKGDSGGELDPHGADGNGNPIGGLVFGNSFGDALQYHEWTSFISEHEFCFRACTGNDARELCQHIYDEMGCYWNMPSNYDEGVFENCEGDSGEPMGVYDRTSTFHQGDAKTPEAHPAPSSSQCDTVPSVAPDASKKARRHHSSQRLARAQASFL